MSYFSQDGGGGIIYVTGHRHPDTDSIVSAIAYAHLRQKQGHNVVPCRLGDLTTESRFILERFNQAEPLFIQDARSQLDESIMDDANKVSENAILRDVIERFDANHKVFTVQDERSHLLGLVTNSSIGQVIWGDTAKAIDLLAETSVENIAKSIDGTLLYAPDESDHNGKVSIIALSANHLNYYELDKRIVVLGNDTQSQLRAIEKGASVLVLVWTKQVAPMVMEAAKKAKCSIILSGHGAMNTSRYIYYAIPVKSIMAQDLIVFSEAEFVDDAREKMMRSRHRAYPIVDAENRVMGMTSRYRLLNAPKRRFVLVDHNEAKQSVPHIELAEVLEIIDHHRIGDLTSDRPIAFRNEPLGATATIVSKMFLENNIQPDSDVAGLLLAAIIADTLNFKSPTTTDQDRAMARHWSDFTGINIEELAESIFKASSQNFLDDLPSLLEGDVKEYMVQDRKIIISQRNLYRLNETEGIQNALEEVMEQKAKDKDAYLWIMMFTTARDNGSIFYAAGPGKAIVSEVFPNKEGESHTFQPGVVSRKNQVVPKIFLYLREGGFYRA